MLTLALTLLACATTPAADAPTPPTVSDTPDTSQTTRQTITLEPHLMTWDDGAGTVTYSPGSDRMSSAYTHFVLSAASVEAALGGRPDAPVQVEVEVSGPTVTTESPEDPNLPQPQGGFEITTWTGRVTRRIE